ncbi:hypothetical protein BJX68DRAFT_59805 [Aspergillus pseudodeflectus]|uniref:ZZ-type domain-containing protein n=1 Tax=Aspergillus pseudodeflectus TaxID=176178 RepID=A0ABR4KK26_9EURO
MPSSIYHASQVLESYTPLFGSAEVDTISSGHASHHHHVLSAYDNGSTRGHNYSSSEMYICCRCGDGPKVWAHQPTCVMCNHTSCDDCTRVK